MPALFTRIGLVVFLLAFTYYFFTHHVLATALVGGLGFAIFIFGATLASLEASGDANFS
jgi:hypothetical protein